ncbi:MAG: four helix bundle protein [Patescibacteria group bacterium]
MSNTTNDSIKKKYDIHQRIYDFIIEVIKIVNLLNKTSSNIVIINQILRSVTSMGANDQEADGALTKKDFVHKLVLVRKEGKETIFWLSLIGDTNSSYIKTKVKPFLTEGNEIVAIVSSIINKTRDRK